MSRTDAVPVTLVRSAETEAPSGFPLSYRALVYASLAASVLVVIWGGIVRVSGSGLGCPDWPLCHGAFLPSLDTPTRIEWTHRFLAIASGLTVAAMVLWTIVRYRAQSRGRAQARAAGVLYPHQAVHGGSGCVFAPSSGLVAVTPSRRTGAGRCASGSWC